MSNIRQLICVPPPVEGPYVPSYELYHINDDRVFNDPTRVLTHQALNIRWGPLGFSEQREPALRRVMRRSDAQLIPGMTLFKIRGRVKRGNLDEIINAVDNLEVQFNPVYSERNFYDPEVIMVERDLTEFVVPVGCYLKLIRHCDVYLGECKIFADVEVQFVVDKNNHKVLGPCRVYVENGPEVNTRIVTLQWTDPTGDRNSWEITDLTLVYGLPVLRKESTVGVCPYCPMVNTFNMNVSNYAQHMTYHGVYEGNVLAPDPVMINNRLSCPICSIAIDVKRMQTPLDAYLAHLGCNQSYHQGIMDRRVYFPGSGPGGGYCGN